MARLLCWLGRHSWGEWHKRGHYLARNLDAEGSNCTRPGCVAVKFRWRVPRPEEAGEFLAAEKAAKKGERRG